MAAERRFGMTQFVVVEEGRPVVRTWCDNPECENWSGRVGIPDSLLEWIEGEGPDEGDFCSLNCQKQAPAIVAVGTRAALAAAPAEEIGGHWSH